MEGGKKEHGEVQCARSLEVMYRGTSECVSRCSLPESTPAAAPDLPVLSVFVDFKTLEKGLSTNLKKQIQSARKVESSGSDMPLGLADLPDRPTPG